MSLPDSARRGIERFNRGEFFEAHEDLEEAWRAEPDPERRLLWQGLTQVAVGFTHLKRGNLDGAITLLERALEKLEPRRPVAGGIELEELARRTRACLGAIEHSRRQGTSFDWAAVPRIERAQAA